MPFFILGVLQAAEDFGVFVRLALRTIFCGKRFAWICDSGGFYLVKVDGG